MSIRNISAHTFMKLTRSVEPSMLAYYLANAYLLRASEYMRARTSGNVNKAAFLNDVGKKFLNLSDKLISIERQFSR